MKSFLALCAAAATTATANDAFVVETTPDRIEIRVGTQTVLGWQQAPLSAPIGGEKFAGSAFLHPLTTPSGFTLTQIQPSDHLHHFGVWWPWKFLEVDGSAFNCWELQAGEGRQLALGAEVTAQSAQAVTVVARNAHQIQRDDRYVTVIEETATLNFRLQDASTYVLDIDLQQKPSTTAKVAVKKYRYSGFSWRGPASWTGTSSRMFTSGGHDRTSANHQPGRWVAVTGPTSEGTATMLVMSAADMADTPPERLRVWNPQQHHGEPFVNFNPVVQKTLAIDDPAVAHRRYRLVLTDRQLTAEQADRSWSAWRDELTAPSPPDKGSRSAP